MNPSSPPPTLFHPLETPFSPASEPEQESLSLISLIHTPTPSSLSLHQLERVTDMPGSLRINAAWLRLHETPSLASGHGEWFDERVYWILMRELVCCPTELSFF